MLYKSWRYWQAQSIFGGSGPKCFLLIVVYVSNILYCCHQYINSQHCKEETESNISQKKLLLLSQGCQVSVLIKGNDNAINHDVHEAWG